MEDFYYFFFSYARGNHENSVWGRKGTNYLDEFYDALCRQVSERTGRSAREVAYRDQSRLKMSDAWDQDLVEGLQKSRVLLSLISPHYLQSDNCGRELSFFDRRLRAYRERGGSHHVHRIIPLFWQDTTVSLQNVSPGVNRFLNGFQHTQRGMNKDYPAAGLSQLIRLCSEAEYEQLCIAVADRIVELATLDPLPELPEQGNFSSLDNLYARLEAEAEEYLLLSGPDGVNVVYLVGTRDEMAAAGAEADRYAEDPREWVPFPQTAGSNIRILTEEGANAVGLRNHRHFKLPENLLRLIEAAEKRNSPVLLVLDRGMLSLSDKAEKLGDYHTRNFENCGLVTAGGDEIPNARVQEVFQVKFRMDYPHHVWDVPPNRETYVSSVMSVLGGIKKHLVSRGRTALHLPGGALPGLSGPSRY
jgi:hypothetical protein